MFPNLPLAGLSRPLTDLNVASLGIRVRIVPLLVNNGVTAFDRDGFHGLTGKVETGRARFGGEKVFDAGEYRINEFGVAANANSASPEGGATGIRRNGGEVRENGLVGLEVLPTAKCFFLFHGRFLSVTCL